MKKQVLVDVKVIADIDRAIRYSRDMESYARQAEGLAMEFNAFVRDHRSMDWVHLHVERQYEAQCEFCHSVWESVPLCCDQAIMEYETKRDLDALSIRKALVPNGEES